MKVLKNEQKERKNAERAELNMFWWKWNEKKISKNCLKKGTCSSSSSSNSLRQSLFFFVFFFVSISLFFCNHFTLSWEIVKSKCRRRWPGMGYTSACSWSILLGAFRAQLSLSTVSSNFQVLLSKVFRLLFECFLNFVTLLYTLFVNSM